MSSEPHKDVAPPGGRDSHLLPAVVSAPVSPIASSNSRNTATRGHPCNLTQRRRKRRVRKTSTASATATAAAAGVTGTATKEKKNATPAVVSTTSPAAPTENDDLAELLQEDDLTTEEMECLMDQLSLTSSTSVSDASGHSPVPPHLRRLIMQQQNRQRARVRRIFQPNSRRLKGSRNLVRAVNKGVATVKSNSGRISARQHAVMAARGRTRSANSAAHDEDGEEPLLQDLTAITVDEEEEPTPLPMSVAPTPLDTRALAHQAIHHVETPNASSSGSVPSHRSPSRPGRSREGSTSKEPTRTASAPLGGFRRKSTVTESDDSHSTLVSSTPLTSSVKRKPLLGPHSNSRSTNSTAAAAGAEHPPSTRRRASTGDAAAVMLESKGEHPPASAATKATNASEEAAGTTSSPTTPAVGGGSSTPRSPATKPVTAIARSIKQPLLNEKAYTSTVYSTHRPRQEPPTSISSHLLKQPLIPELISPEEADRTLTIVLDLDETLCNNRCIGPALIRPGALALLHRLRDMAPPPAYKEVPRRNQHASNRLYEQAMTNNGLIPRERSSSTASGDPHAPGVRLEIVLWTASVEVVARPVVDRLDPGVNIFDHIIYRDARWYRESSFAKDLRRLGRNMDNIAIVENAPASVALNRRQAILVNDFIRNRNDKQLYVVQLILVEWVRKSNLQLHRNPSIISNDSVTASSTTSTSNPPANSNLGPLQQTAMRKKEEERKAAAKGDATVANRAESASAPAEHVINIGLFLSKHRFMSPGTSYVKLSAVREVGKLLLKTTHSSSNANEDEEEEKDEKPKAKQAPLPPPAPRSKSSAAANRSGGDKKKQPRSPSVAAPAASASPPTPSSTTKRTATPSNGTPTTASPRRSPSSAPSAPASKRALSKSKAPESNGHGKEPSQASGNSATTSTTSPPKCGLTSIPVVAPKASPKKEVASEVKKNTTSTTSRNHRAAWQT